MGGIEEIRANTTRILELLEEGTRTSPSRRKSLRGLRRRKGRWCPPEKTPAACSRWHRKGGQQMMWFRPGFLFGGLMLLCWATVVIVVAALTTWWVLFALLPLVMMMSGMAMMGTTAPSTGTDPRAGPWGWCAAWFAPAVERRWEVNLALTIPLAELGHARRCQRGVDDRDDALDAALLGGSRRGLSGSRVEDSTVGGKDVGRRPRRSSNGDSPKRELTRGVQRTAGNHRHGSRSEAREKSRATRWCGPRVVGSEPARVTFPHAGPPERSVAFWIPSLEIVPLRRAVGERDLETIVDL